MVSFQQSYVRTHVKNTKEVGKFKVISKFKIASGLRRVESLRDKQLNEYEKSQEKNIILKEKTAKEQLEKIKKELLSYNIEPDLSDDKNLTENLKILNKQIEKIKIQSVIKDKGKNKIKDKKNKNFTIREQVLYDFPPKELRGVIDQGKKILKKV